MDARSALFDLYGDHLRARGGRAPVAALVRLLAPLDVAAPAVRTAVSRMVRQGWLEPCRVAGAPGYALTRRADERVSEAGARIYRTDRTGWDGTWHVLVVPTPPRRAGRERLDRGLRFLGYAPLGSAAWVAARRSAEVDAVLVAEGVRAEEFVATHDGDSVGLAGRAWDLDALARAYRRWTGDARSLVAAAGDDPSDETAFVVRSRLVHEWRKFLFTDPGLPRELLPADWPGDDAAALFDGEAGRLAAGASRFVTACLGPRPMPYDDDTRPDRVPSEESLP